jgi:filamentous hemagglutinin
VTDLCNRRSHPDERKWVKDNAQTFAAYCEDTTGPAITADHAQQMLLAGRRRIFDVATSAGPAPDGNKYATSFISENGNGLFGATASEYRNPSLYGKPDHSLKPE